MSTTALPGRRNARPALAAALSRAGITLALPAMLVALVWSAFYSVIGGFVGDTPAAFIDAPSFYYAAVTAIDWAWSPYEAGIILAWKYDLGRHVFPFLYPPPAIAVFAPLALVSYGDALLALLLTNFAAIVVIVGVLYARYVKSLPEGNWTWIALGVLCFHFGFVRTVMNGQINLIVLLLVLVAWGTAGQRRWSIVTGLALALAILLKTYPVVLLGVFLLRRDWRVIGVCLAGLAGIGAWSLQGLPADAWSDWLRDVAPTGRWGVEPFMLFDPGRYCNISLNGLLSRLFDADVVGFLALPLTVAVLGATFTVFWRLRHLPTRAFYDWAFPLTLVATFLIAPLSWTHHGVFLLPGMLILLNEAARRRPPVSKILAGIVLFFSFYWRPVAKYFEWVATFPALAVVAIWVALLVVAAQQALLHPAQPAARPNPDPRSGGLATA